MSQVFEFPLVVTEITDLFGGLYLATCPVMDVKHIPGSTRELAIENARRFLQDAVDRGERPPKAYEMVTVTVNADL